MSEQQKKKEEREETILDHVAHDHPLILEECSKYQQCDGCLRHIFHGEMVYKCQKKCPWSPLLHEECAELPREIKHPQRTFIQVEMQGYNNTCSVCEYGIMWIGYNCCPTNFKTHLGCAPNMSLLQSRIHPSHPHQLTLQWRPGRSCSSRCDACGTIHKGSPYVCAICQYWVLESCANLPADADYPHLHHHPLSLAFSLPTEYARFDFSCKICLKGFFPKYWVYHCGICRYVVHIKCAVTANRRNTDLVDADDKNAITFPINNAGEELIGPFVMSVVGAKAVPRDNEIGISKCKFHNHHHQLDLIPFSLHNHEEDDDRGIGEDELNCRRRSELICDGCTTPIFEKKQKSECNYYMSCSECKYFLHGACFNLPPEFPTHPVDFKGHTLILRTPPTLEFTRCDICYLLTSGLICECTRCNFRIDIKCASLPDTIKHTAHPNHHLKLLRKDISWGFRYISRIDILLDRRICKACGQPAYKVDVCYKCDICEIIIHASCALLPATVSNPTWDRHLFPLTFDASIDHPSAFYCEICEEEMNPNLWMYHCRTCDFSFHPRCFPTVSGQYKNIVFGRRYNVVDVHRHPLVFQLLTSKLHCDVCIKRKEYGCLGFQCASHGCDFFMCFDPCGRSRRHTFEDVHQFRLTL